MQSFDLVRAHDRAAAVAAGAHPTRLSKARACAFSPAARRLSI